MLHMYLTEIRMDVTLMNEYLKGHNYSAYRLLSFFKKCFYIYNVKFFFFKKCLLMPFLIW